jgi:hypothetical protein
MRNLFLLSIPVTAMVFAACGGSTETSASTGTTTGTSSGDTTSSSTTGAGGATSSTSSSTATGTSTGTGTSSSTSGAGGGSECSGYVDVVEDNGAPFHFASICQGFGLGSQKTASGYLFAGGPVGAPSGTKIIGCATMNASSPGIVLEAYDAMSPGTYSTGLTQYTDQGGSPWGFPNDPIEVKITKLEPVGGVIEGTFKATVSHVMNGNAAHNLTGTFHVCHTMDLFAP